MVFLMKVLFPPILFSFKKSKNDELPASLIEDNILLNSDELLKHAKLVAKTHSYSKTRKGYTCLLERLNDSYRYILNTYKTINKDVKEGQSMCPSTEWLLDNFYIVEELVKNIKLNLTKQFCTKLEILQEGYLKNYPRILALSIELISHTDGKLDEKLIVDFVNSYQDIKVLSLSEIWALSPMLKFALVEKLRLICEKINIIQKELKKAEESVKDTAEETISYLKENIKEPQDVNPAYITPLLKNIKRKGLNQQPLMEFLDKKLTEFDINLDRITNFEHQEQAAMQISIGNCISSLRLLSSINWHDIFDMVSKVEHILRQDPSSVYSNMDRETKDYYRRHIEKISSKLGISETNAARKVVELAQSSEEEVKNHVGYYILGEGLEKLMSGFKASGKGIGLEKNSLWVYLLPAAVITAAVSLGMAALIRSYLGTYSIIVFFILLIPSSEIAVSIINWIFTHTFKPSFLPKLEYAEGIPDSCKSIVVVPVLIPNAKRARELVKQLEVTYLQNRDKNLIFAILGDYKDTTEENLPDDKDIAATVLKEIEDLNKKYSDEKEIFFYFHRSRTYNKNQNKWMGWERKRGAIMEFNELLRGSNSTSYSIISSPIFGSQYIKYAITLDADTILPIGAGKRLIGTISHPLNRGKYDDAKGIVTQGYGLIQPRIGINIESSGKSLFTKIYAGSGGIDVYTTATSDVYQDLFHEGIFTGKGIYDIDIFLKALKGKIPESSILSHDLLEGSYVRAGLATDIILIDGFPEKYSSYIMRSHRWVRGDWQLVKWLLPTIKNESGQRITNLLSSLSKWKILDNLRRSLLTVGLILTIWLGLALPLEAAITLLIFSIAVLFIPFIFSLVNYAAAKENRIYKSPDGESSISQNISAFYQALLNFSFLPYNAFMMADAVLRTLYRVLISKKNLLQWVTAADMEKSLKNDLKSCYIRMLPALYITFALIFSTWFLRKENLLLAVLLGVIWLLSPHAAFVISKVKTIEAEPVSKENLTMLRRLARKTWAFYEDFAGEENNFLPIDNYQETPVSRTAGRTSPTNIGFLLLSVISASDFGYISIPQTVDRLEKTISTLEKLEKWNGHLFNWYDTATLDILRPRYISTVDSGNLVGYLITVKEGLLEYLNKPIISKKLLSGLKDSILLSGRADTGLMDLIESLEEDNEFTFEKWSALLETLSKDYHTEGYWEEKILSTVREHKQELESYFPGFLTRPELLQQLSDNPFFNGIKPLLCKLNLTASILEVKDSCEKLDSWIIKAADAKSENSVDDCFLNLVRDYIKLVDCNLGKLIDSIIEIADRLESLIRQTDFKALYNSKQGLFSIGYNVDENKLTNSYYDLLASEARLASYIGVIRNEVPVEHWFSLGRSLVDLGGYRSLVSWTGTMFEYFMPGLIMKNYPNTLLNETYSSVIKAQIEYGRRRKVPWGTSESGYYTFDLNLNYQYRAFGVPYLGLKRDLIKDMVVSPYSTVLALPFAPGAALNNLKQLASNDFEGAYGLYEAVDYTPERLSQGKDYALVESYMAHHQGMILVSINNALNENIMVKRFHSSPLVIAGEFLLQEKVPFRVIMTKEYKETVEPLGRRIHDDICVRREFKTPESYIPACGILSNGDYSVITTNSGSGYSRKGSLAVTRWRGDMSSRKYGYFFFIRDINSNRVWPAVYDPMQIEPDDYYVEFSPHKSEYIRVDDTFETHTEICVSPEDNCEVRRVTIINHGSEEAVLECTSYLETVLAPQMSDIAHPSFSNLFIRTEVLEDCSSLLASRRPREEKKDTIWSFHTLASEGECIGEFEYETDRYKFIGRGREISSAIALNHPLSKTVGPVLDPIMSIRRRVKINPGKSVILAFSLGVAENRDKAVELAKKYSDISIANREFELSYIRSVMELQFLGFSADEIEFFDSMISHILFLSPLRLRQSQAISNNSRGQSGLWAYGISGDIPIVVVTIKEAEEIDIVKVMINAHDYWRVKGLSVDLVIINEDEGSYHQPLQHLFRETVSSSSSRYALNQHGGIFIIETSKIKDADRNLIYAAAGFVIHGCKGDVQSQLKTEIKPLNDMGKSEFKFVDNSYKSKDTPLDLAFFNGYGGFNLKDNEYVIRLKKDNNTPAPWVNVIANRNFGFIVTESGGGFTWSENSRENKITPWSNDPVSDPPGEILYLRDDLTGEVWTITPLPIREEESYTIAHGLGYTKFHHLSHGIDQELTVFIPREEQIKLSLVKLKNTSPTRRRLSLYYYINPVLGVTDEITKPYIVTSLEKESSSLLIRNSYNSDFPGRITYINTSAFIESYTGDKKEFIGHHANISEPDGLHKVMLTNTLGSGYDPCLAVQIPVEIGSNEDIELSLMLGQSKDLDTIIKTVNQYKNLENCRQVLAKSKQYWKDLCQIIQVTTPDQTMDILLNSWLVYQTIVCRLWARSGFYQCGGAYGFRDQLQDSMNIVNQIPEFTREQILLHCAHQFIEGDVQHWWHPGAGEKGIRTRFSDDLVWLPYAASEYIESTGDFTILDETVSFLEDAPLKDGEDERYGIPSISEEKSSVYDHCIRAIERSLKFGANGIPLMGSGDWNDGMNTVGNKGHGESVWLGWFIYNTLIRFIPLCNYMKDEEHKQKYEETARKIIENIELNAWDGQWYLRAFFDDGTPLGSSSNSECKIDSISQSWSIISGGGRRDRALQSLQSVEDYLINENEGLIQLFTPPFGNGDLKPGYIRGYVPGVRENGGQYTHAATWVIYAFAKLCLGDKAANLFHLINPINHSRTPAECAKYKVEPYVIAADIYAAPPHVGRGGWTWYTGSSGWMYRVGIEQILGFCKTMDSIVINPCIPREWDGFTIKYKFQETNYTIIVKNPEGTSSGVKLLTLDGIPQNGANFKLVNDKGEHIVEVILG